MADSFSAYLASIGRIPMLTPSEEVVLAQQVQEYLNTENPSPQLVRRGRRAHQRMVKANLRLVVTIAKKYSVWGERVGLSLDDLVQEGAFGLSRAVDRFDPQRGYKFSTYAYWWVRQAMQRALQTTAGGRRMIRVPVQAQAIQNKAASARLELTERLGRPPTTGEIAEVLDVEEGWLREQLMLLSRSATTSLDAPCADGDSNLLDLVADPSAETACDMDRQLAMDAVSVLDETDQDIIERHLLRGETLRSLSESIGLSPERVRQRRDKALRRMHVQLNQGIAASSAA